MLSMGGCETRLLIHLVVLFLGEGGGRWGLGISMRLRPSSLLSLPSLFDPSDVRSQGQQVAVR